MSESKIFINIQKLYNLCKFEEAEKEILKLYEKLEKYNSNDKLQIACILIDIGHRTKKAYPNYCGLEILKKYKKEYLKTYSISSYEYNLGNAYSGIFDDKDKRKYTIEDFKVIIKAKNHYWKSIKHIKEKREKNLKYINNLANSLKACYRISESLFYYDSILNINPSFYQANVSKIDCLKLLKKISYTSTNNLCYEIYKCYINAKKNKDISSNEVKLLEKELSEFINYSKEKNIKYDEIKQKIIHSKKEFNNHTNLRKSILKNNLALSEVGLYSRCCGARKDNLSIFTKKYHTNNIIFKKMEIYLNEIKSDFNLLRLLYFDSQKKLIKFSKYENEITYKLSLQKHKIDIRTSYKKNIIKICFNILDKIAFAFCDFYNLSTSNNKIYFEGFWWNKNIYKELNKIINPGLIGLYSIATDINNKSGELNFFKDWRNSIEHNYFIVLENSKSTKINIHNFFNKNVICLNEDELNDNLFSLIQIVRSAIFCFVWFIRYELYKENYIKRDEKNEHKYF